MSKETTSFGPAMRACNERQRAFVYNLLEFGDDNFTRAARVAGYSDPGVDSTTIRVTASRLAHDPKIQAAMQEEAKRRLHGGTILAASTLVGLAKNGDPKVQLKAIEMILNRSGMQAMSEHKVTVEHTMNEEDMVKSIQMMAQKMGVDASALLGEAGVKMLPPPRQVPMDVIDADFSEVVSNLEGLDDCL